MNWTSERVIALAPDAGSAKAGRDLATERSWRSLGGTETAIWGECQGSGAKPYQTQIDITEPAFKCSCPSRKFPCKHGLGLLLLRAERPALLPSADPPAWVAEWLAKRKAKAEQRMAPARDDAEGGAGDNEARRSAARERRTAGREARVAEGLDELGRWLGDLLTQGLAAARQRPTRAWHDMAARLIDAQAPGAARLVAECGELAAGGDDWAEKLLHRLARLHLLIAASRRIEHLAPPLQADIRTAVGWTIAESEVMAGEGLADDWYVLGQALGDDGRLRTQRVWLVGHRSQRFALLLDFAARGQALPVAPPGGAAFQAELAFYPSAEPMRAVIRTHGAAADFTPSGHAAVADALHTYAAALGRNPFIERFPLLLARARVARQGDTWLVVDPAGQALPVRRRFDRGWEMLALDGGHGATVFGEWDGMAFAPISVLTRNRQVDIAA